MSEVTVVHIVLAANGHPIVFTDFDQAYAFEAQEGPTAVGHTALLVDREYGSALLTAPKE